MLSHVQTMTLNATSLAVVVILIPRSGRIGCKHLKDFRQRISNDPLPWSFPLLVLCELERQILTHSKIGTEASQSLPQILYQSSLLSLYWSYNSQLRNLCMPFTNANKETQHEPQWGSNSAPWAFYFFPKLLFIFVGKRQRMNHLRYGLPCWCSWLV